MSENNDEVPRKRFGTYFVVAVSLGALLAGAAVGVLIGRHRADPDKASQVEALAGAIDQCHHQVTRKAMRDGRGGGRSLSARTTRSADTTNSAVRSPWWTARENSSRPTARRADTFTPAR
ncbi:hypothetical protein ACFQY4_22350 [Catellatospora bangladeshensis]|uniref:hypothetical protein n=1 Tax=Catellatospora bangladeshensis TaxID=310355 RepID=UPI003614DE8F